jgi:hypothetical protein
MAAASLLNPRLAYSVFDGFLESCRRDMVSTLDARARIDRAFDGGKGILPQSRRASGRVFAVKRIWQIYFTIPFQHIGFMEELHSGQMTVQRLLNGLWQYSHPILCASSVAHHDLMIREVEVFHSQAQAFHEAQAGPIEQTGHEMVHAGELCQHSGANRYLLHFPKGGTPPVKQVM